MVVSSSDEPMVDDVKDKEPPKEKKWNRAPRDRAECKEPPDASSWARCRGEQDPRLLSYGSFYDVI